MAILPTLISFWVHVRNYRLSTANLLVQSPNVDLKAQAPRIIIRSVNGEYIGEPRVLDPIIVLQDDIKGQVYRHAAHGVRVSPKSRTDNFPVWVCLERNDHRRKNDICMLNLSNLEFSVVAITSICWVPSHEAANGDLYTVIGTPGKHGYEKEMRLPTIVQRIGFPGQTKFSLPPSSLSGLKRLELARQEELFNQQYNHFQKGYWARPTIILDMYQNLYNPRKRRRSHAAVDEDLEFSRFYNDDLPSSGDEESTGALIKKQRYKIQEKASEGLCRCPCTYSDLGPTFLDPRPLHRHATDDQCALGSIHQLHCIFAAHRPEHCVISGSVESHEHCPQDGMHSTVVDPLSGYAEHQAVDTTLTVNDVVAGGIEKEPDYDTEIESLHAELERLSGAQCFRDGERVLKDRDIWASSIVDMPITYLESRPISPLLELALGCQAAPDDLPDPILNPTAVQGPIWNVDYHISMTPEPPEMHM
ncbi:hypothetical protein HD806DRAFT_523997 [Xylariaceae sp. AK1471]|nr:hypothetical protein HD806DRAFT_523997 [Xylariaceae sp. AK1471]